MAGRPVLTLAVVTAAQPRRNRTVTRARQDAADPARIQTGEPR
jgi:hypothetical protein